MCYKKRYKLSDIARLICVKCNNITKSKINNTDELGKSYCAQNRGLIEYLEIEDEIYGLDLGLEVFSNIMMKN